MYTYCWLLQILEQFDVQADDVWDFGSIITTWNRKNNKHDKFTIFYWTQSSCLLCFASVWSGGRSWWRLLPVMRSALERRVSGMCPLVRCETFCASWILITSQSVYAQLCTALHNDSLPLRFCYLRGARNRCTMKCRKTTAPSRWFRRSKSGIACSLQSQKREKKSWSERRKTFMQSLKKSGIKHISW